jgi:hypothetical protein
MKKSQPGTLDLNQVAKRHPRCDDMAAALTDKGGKSAGRTAPWSRQYQPSGGKPGKFVTD